MAEDRKRIKRSLFQDHEDGQSKTSDFHFIAYNLNIFIVLTLLYLKDKPMRICKVLKIIYVINESIIIFMI